VNTRLARSKSHGHGYGHALICHWSLWQSSSFDVHPFLPLQTIRKAPRKLSTLDESQWQHWRKAQTIAPIIAFSQHFRTDTMASEHHSLPQAYIDAYSGQKLVTFCICFIVLLTVCILLRFWARRVKGGIALDDYLSIPSYILCVGLCGLGIGMLSPHSLCNVRNLIGSAGLVQHAGVGRHAAALAVVNPTALITMGKSIIGIAYLYLPAVALPKLSILALYWRFLDRSPAYRRTIQALAGITILNLVTCLIVFSVECQPFAYHWNKKIPGGHCVNEAAMFAYVSLPNIITDVVMLLLPMRVVYKLKANGSTKAGLLVVFVTGNM
jgi:hypothetical protein